MEELKFIALGISITGGIHDLLTRRIPNWLTIPAIILGLVAQFWYLGFTGLFSSFLGTLLGFGLFFPIYYLGYMGAGDVKLLMAIGSWVGWDSCLHIAIYSVILGGVYAFFDILFHRRGIVVIKNTFSFLRSILVPFLVVEKLHLDKDRKFAFGFYIFLLDRSHLPLNWSRLSW
jgi:prepilin peptidase CpaA